MRLLRATLLVLAAGVILAVAAPTTASAMTIEARYEDDDTSCSAVSLSGTDVDGGCLLHAVSDGGVIMKQHVFGMEVTVSVCESEFHARIDEDAAGYILEQVLTSPPGLTCTLQACKSGGGEQQPWAIDIDDPGDDTELMTANLCVEPSGGGTDQTCEVDLPVVETAPSSNEFQIGDGGEVAGHGVAGSRCEIEGQWITEMGDTHDAETEEAVVLAPVSVISTAAVPTAGTLYTGGLWASNVGNVTFDAAGDTATCATSSLKPYVASTTGGGSAISYFSAATLGSCGGENIQWLFGGDWRGTFHDRHMRMVFTDVYVRWVGTFLTCNYKGNLTSSVTNPGAWLRFTFLSTLNVLPAVPGSAGGCGAGVEVNGTYDMGTDANPSAKVWLVGFIP